MSPGADEALALPSKYEGAFRALQASAPTKGSAACILLGNKRLAREGKPPLWRLAVYLGRACGTRYAGMRGQAEPRTQKSAPVP